MILEHDYSRVGGRKASFFVRDDVRHDPGVLKEVTSYAVMPVEGRSVLDIGGYIGGYSVLALQLGAEFVTAVEPDPGNYAVLARNLETNAVEGTYECLFGAAVGREFTRSVDIWLKDCPAMNSLYVEGGRRVKVPAFSWSRLFARREYQAVKLDCEGAEYELLSCGIPACVECVVMEFHLHAKRAWRERDSREVLGLFENWECLHEPRITATNWVTWGAWRR